MSLHDILCKIGFHNWESSRELNAYDAFPMAQKWKNPTRKCTLCETEQYWLPGYGGSEIGSWEPEYEGRKK